MNPVKNVWQFIRDNWLSNRVFKDYDDIVKHRCESWNKLMDQPSRIMSIGKREWVLITERWYKGGALAAEACRFSAVAFDPAGDYGAGGGVVGGGYCFA